MRKRMWNVLILPFVILASAKTPRECSAPLEYPSTRLDKKFASKKSFNSGEKVYFNCAEDFTPYKGSRAVQCVAGRWTPLTLKCEKISCGNAGDLPHGFFHYEGNSYLGEKVYAVCNEGYTLKGLNYMICKRSGWTGDFPSCEEGEPTCSAPKVAHSVKSSNNVSAYRVGENVSLTCSPGFQLEGAQHITCSPAGQWQPKLPQCKHSPDNKNPPLPDKTVGCNAPVDINNLNSKLAGKYIKRTNFASGERVHYVCDVGYTQAGGSRYRRCINGKWTPLLLRCERKLCGSAGEILNGQFMYTGVEFGDTATAVCNEGFNLFGRATRNCMSNGWDGHAPVCEAEVCEEPPKVINAEIKGQHEPPYTYGSIVLYECRVGTLIGNEAIWCTKDKMWSTPPECKELTCPAPSVPFASWVGSQTKLYQYRDAISIECNHGYALMGPSTITCGDHGQWFPGLPRCTRKSFRSNRWRKSDI
ncbi:membrane cofactor protein-like [Aulostomus maculatus]